LEVRNRDGPDNWNCNAACTRYYFSDFSDGWSNAMNVRNLALPAVSIIGLTVSLAGTVYFLKEKLDLSDLSISLVSAIVAGLAGVFSSYGVHIAKKLSYAPRVFISYSHSDQAAASEVVAALRTSGARVWLEEERVKPGESIRKAVEKGIENADTFVALLSEKPGSNLLLELDLARAKGIRVVPVLLSNAEVPLDLQGVRYIDLRHDRSAGIKQLVRAVI
jgi:hypothetical protein